jgi:hypothetical protein
MDKRLNANIFFSIVYDKLELLGKSKKSLAFPKILITEWSFTENGSFNFRRGYPE